MNVRALGLVVVVVAATATLKSAPSTLAGSTTDAFPGVMGSVHREWSLVPQG